MEKYEDRVYILFKHKICIFFSGKCGNTTLRKWYLNFRYNINTNNLKEIRVKTDRLIKHFFSDKYNKGFCKDYINVIIVRNPYDRVVSMFMDKFIYPPGNIQKFFSTEDITFNIFLKFLKKEQETYFYKCNNHFIPQSLSREKIKFDYIIKLESFQDDMLNFINNEIDRNYKYDFTTKAGNFKSIYNDTNNEDHSNLCLTKLRTMNSINKKSFLNSKNKEIIYNLYKNDFLLFNYGK